MLFCQVKKHKQDYTKEDQTALEHQWKMTVTGLGGQQIAKALTIKGKKTIIRRKFGSM